MKIILFITAAVIVASCIRRGSQTIEGVYTRESFGEFSRAFDTVIIFKYDANGDTYLTRRKTRFIRYKDGVAQPEQWRDEKMITAYDESTNQLVDKKTGRLFSFKPGELLFGTAKYTRVGS